MVSYFIKRTFDNGLLADLLEAFEAECVTTGKRKRFLLGMIVLLETHSAFKNRVHLIIGNLLLRLNFILVNLSAHFPQ
jgi:hypothetical protein